MKKLKGDHLGKNLFKKSRKMPQKIERGGPLVSAGIVCYKKKGKTFLTLFAWPNGSI